jgi:hypothetical protein
VVLLYHGARVSYLVPANPGLQGDLRIYRAAAQAWVEGRNPYEPGALVGPAGNRQELPFVYPPLSLPFMRAPLVFDHRTTYLAFFVLKMAGVAALVALWRRRLFPDDDLAGACLYLFCALAYAQTIKMDVRAGNISVFEQVLIWTGVLGLRRGRPWVYAALVSAAALFKLTTAALLLLLLLDRSRRPVAALVSGMAGLAVVHGISAALRPDLFAGFLRNAAALDDRGRTNPAALALIRDGVEGLPGPAPPHLDWILYGLVVLLVAGSFLSLVRRSDIPDHLDGVVYAFFLAFALAAPRFKDYSYILLVPPSVYVVVNVLQGFVPRLLAVLLVCTHLFAYQSWVAALVLFIALLARPRTRVRRPPGPAEAPGPA